MSVIAPVVNDYPDTDAYKGPLLDGALESIERIRRQEITPDEYLAEINALFDRHPPEVELAEWIEKALSEGRDQMLYWRSKPNGIRYQLIHMRPYEVHPPHGHANLISNQMVLRGRVYLREYDRIDRVDDDTILLKLRSDGWLEAGDRIDTTAVDREIHWFGAGAETAVQLNLSISGFQQWTTDGGKAGRRGRLYLDPTQEAQADGLILGKQITVDQSEGKFQNRLLTDFPIPKPRRPVAAA